MIFQKDFWETVRIYRHSQYQNIHLALQEKIIERVLHEIQFESKFVGGSFLDKKCNLPRIFLTVCRGGGDTQKCLTFVFPPPDKRIFKNSKQSSITVLKTRKKRWNTNIYCLALTCWNSTKIWSSGFHIQYINYHDRGRKQLEPNL